MDTLADLKARHGITRRPLVNVMAVTPAAMH